jgi:pyruvate dehydrogenase E2 component (dihydrolipoamide acetyltransferase)
MPQLEAAGETIHYLKAGSGAKVIVLVHGFGSDARSWTMNQPALATAATVYALDLPGHGASPARDIGGLDRLAEVVGAAITALTPEPVHLIGHSMGGAVALRAATLSPDAVRALTLIAPAGLGETLNPDFIPNFLAMTDAPSAEAALQMLVSNPALINRQILQGVLAAHDCPHIYEAWKKMLPIGHEIWARRAEALAAVSALRKPVQIIWGEGDLVLPPPGPDALPPNVRLHRMAGLGHVPHMEAMKAVNGLIVAFDDETDR